MLLLTHFSPCAVSGGDTHLKDDIESFFLQFLWGPRAAITAGTACDLGDPKLSLSDHVETGFHKQQHLHGGEPPASQSRPQPKLTD